MYHTRSGKAFSVFLLPAFCLLLFISCFLSLAYAEGQEQKYDRGQALLSLINPHEQIDDEGEILWGKCLICHPEVPDIKKVKSIDDVKLRFEDDLKMLCFRCHPEKMHPGGDWMGAAMGKGPGAPNHWIKPPEQIARHIEKTLQRLPIILPLEPKTGKIFCATCHNPHERGLLTGKAEYGADHELRLRSPGGPICMFCHSK